MDDLVRVPDRLTKRPVPNAPKLAATLVCEDQGGIFSFDLDSQSIPGCPHFRGVRVFRDFLSTSAADDLIREIEQTRFDKAQSGKLKQHYGPKINFNKKKMNADGFLGLPGFAAPIEAELRRLAMEDSTMPRSCADDERLARAIDCFETTDVFVLRYRDRDASNLDFHRDDIFAYGELILDLSLESDSMLTFFRVSLSESGRQVEECVRVPLPARSLVAIYGSARFDWEHAILAYDIVGQRTSITFRTLQEDLRNTEQGRRVMELARNPRIQRESRSLRSRVRSTTPLAMG